MKLKNGTENKSPNTTVVQPTKRLNTRKWEIEKKEKNTQCMLRSVVFLGIGVVDSKGRTRDDVAFAQAVTAAMRLAKDYMQNVEASEWDLLAAALVAQTITLILILTG